MSPGKKILDLISKHGALKPKDIATLMENSPQAIHRHLKVLLDGKRIQKQGTPPTVFYKLGPSNRNQTEFTDLPETEATFINNNHSYLEPSGKLLSGVEGFKS